MVEKTKRAFSPDAADQRLLLPVYLLGILFPLLFMPFKLGVNVPIFIICIYIIAFWYQQRANAPIDRGSASLLLIVMIASLPFVLYDVSPFRVLHFIVLMGAVLFQLYTMFSCREYRRLSENWLFDLVNAVLLTPLANLDAFWRVLFGRVQRDRVRTVLLIGAGLLVALPLLILLSMRLFSADAAFELFLGRAGQPFRDVFFFILLTLALAAPAAMILYGALFGFRWKRSANLLKKPSGERLHVIPAEAVIAALIPICLLQSVYLASQFAYLFSSFSGSLPEDFTFAEYARRGFLELCAVSLLNLSVIIGVLAFTKHKKRVTEKAVNALVILLCVCSLVMIGVVFAKMILYMLNFGLTANRIITSWFMLGLALVFLFTIIRCFRPSFHLVRTVTVTAIVMFLMLCFVDCDYLALSYNKDAYLSGRLEGFDVAMLENTGDSVVPLVIELYEQADGELKSDARALLSRYAEHYGDAPLTWRSFNIARYNARNRFLRWQSLTGFSPDP